jgi:hypothetical protein
LTFMLVLLSGELGRNILQSVAKWQGNRKSNKRKKNKLKINKFNTSKYQVSGS